jgi:hypothetical protein
MNILYIILVKIIQSELIRLTLDFHTRIPFINIKIGNKTTYNMVFDTTLNRSLLVSPFCKICTRKGYNIKDSLKLYDNQTELKYHYFFFGNEYKDKATIMSKLNDFDFNFISFTNVSDTSQIGINGFFSLSFTNYNLNTNRKIFSLKYSSEFLYLFIGDINKEIIGNESLGKHYNVSFNENKNQWYLNAKNVKINNKNATMNESQKLILDSSTSLFLIPKKFFFDNIDLIFPEEGNCQVLNSGDFLCECDKNFKKKFGNFQFIINDEILFINVTDYISLDSSITGMNCYVIININYENDYWYAGSTILNNYYSIFDVDNNTLSLFNEHFDIETNAQFIITFTIVFLISICIFFGGYMLYKKYVIDDDNDGPINEVQ